MSEDIKITKDEYLAELAIMMREAFAEACDNDAERNQFRLDAIGLLTQLEDTEIPQTAPELYKDRERKPELGNKKENPFQFLERVYGQWLGKGLTRSHIKSLDLRLYEAISKKLYNKDPSIPENFDFLLLKTQGLRIEDIERSALKLTRKIQLSTKLAVRALRSS